jgi:hypothetical protein
LLVITVTGGHAMHLADVARTLQPVIDSIAVNVP